MKWLLAVVLGICFSGCQTSAALAPGQEAISESNPAGETNPPPSDPKKSPR